MARCGCASDTCACYIVEGPNVSVTGTGSRDNPYVVSAATTVVNPDGTPTGGTPTADPRFIGEIITYAGDAAPTSDYTLCDGKALSRTVYAILFSRIGTVYGAGDGSTTFNVPPTADKVVVGISGSRPRGFSGGSATVALTADMLPPHAHAIDHNHAAFTTGADGAHTHAWAQSFSDTDGGINTVKRNASATGATAAAPGGTHTHSVDVPAFAGPSGNGPGTSAVVSVMQPHVAIPQYIRIQGGP